MYTSVTDVVKEPVVHSDYNHWNIQMYSAPSLQQILSNSVNNFSELIWLHGEEKIGLKYRIYP